MFHKNFLIFPFWIFSVHLTSTIWANDDGWPQVVGSSQPIVAALGDDVVLPCHVEPQLNVERLTVSWWRPDLPPDPGDPLSQYKYVHRYHDNHDVEDLKMSAYAGRTALGAEGLKHGDVSLKITNVKLSDQGRYRCHVPQLGRASIIKLVVEPKPVQMWLTETPVLPTSLQTADPREETVTTVQLSRSRVVPVVVFCTFLLCAGVCGCLLRRRGQRQDLSELTITA